MKESWIVQFLLEQERFHYFVCSSLITNSPDHRREIAPSADETVTVRRWERGGFRRAAQTRGRAVRWRRGVGALWDWSINWRLMKSHSIRFVWERLCLERRDKCHIKDWCTLPIMLLPVERSEAGGQWRGRTAVTWRGLTKAHTSMGRPYRDEM